MSVSGSQSEQALRDRIKEGGFALALSGGGHRATLATLGALLAIVDRGLGSKILQVASVSGGSITNAFVAQRVKLERLEPGQLDDTARELATTIIQKGVLTRRWISVLFFIPLILGAVAGIIFHLYVIPWTWLSVSVGISVALMGFFARGLAVEWLIDRRFFRLSTPAKSCNHWDRASLASLSGSQTDHVFCMTDLVLGLPVYASSQHGGFIWRRLKLEPEFRNQMPFQTFSASGVSLAELVRASAAFPGIPPRRLKAPPDKDNPRVSESPHEIFLADGGIWNNLGSQVLREDGFIGSHAAWDAGVIRPYGYAPEDMPLLCINGSASPKPRRPWIFKIPGFALFNSLLQITQILNINTVFPRVIAMQRAFERRVWTSSRPNHRDPADLIADLSPVNKNLEKYLAGTWKPELIRETDPSVKKWEKDTLSRVRDARENRGKPYFKDWLTYVIGPPEPQGSYPVCGLASVDDWNALQFSPIWKKLVQMDGVNLIEAPTTLGRIKKPLARSLIARGYLNTYLISLFLAPLTEGEIDRLDQLPERLDRIVGINSEA